eukprot:CAMPEP_0117618780 /NCGR_PEP_ID=MMETSP0784-20121206/86278_1 /TAXON_ID=39447 /ORGANISM="" /LENGTH=601 /DNA_ID=CAMNT_0005422651 /DNA_START=49 /DNA_END=1850 /DNA_ORIENTATION=-
MLSISFHVVLVAVAMTLRKGFAVFLPRQHVQNGRIPSTSKGDAPRPNILFILLDDAGWSDLGFNTEDKTASIGVATPKIDALAATGVVLKRYYVDSTCSPTRSAIQSGRAPVHVNVHNAGTVHNLKDPIGGFAGIPRNMTSIAEVLRGAGYKTHMVGKWDVGMATPDHTPAGRGYDSSLVYFHHTNDLWNFNSEEMCKSKDGHHISVKDLWHHDSDETSFPGEAARSFVNDDACRRTSKLEDIERMVGRCQYEEELFSDRVAHLITRHQKRNGADPFFIFWATRGMHGHFEAPPEPIRTQQLLNQASFEKYYTSIRQRRWGMLTWLDGAIGATVDLLKDSSRAVPPPIVLSSDNGAGHEGNNAPLRGGKHSNWEGGIRTPAFVTGGALPAAMRGKTLDTRHGLIAAWDWYATFAALAGADPTDRKAKRAGLPPVESVNVWPLISGEVVTSPRQAIVVGTYVGESQFDKERGNEKATVGGLLAYKGDTLYKLILGQSGGDRIECAGVTGPNIDGWDLKPNEFCNQTRVCGRTPATGCLFDVGRDESESKNLAAKEQQLFRLMLKERDEHEEGVYSPNRTQSWARHANMAACDVAVKEGFWVP